MILDLRRSLLAQVFSNVFNEFQVISSINPHRTASSLGFPLFSSFAGAIPPMAEMQAMWWCRLLEDKVKDSMALARW